MNEALAKPMCAIEQTMEKPSGIMVMNTPLHNPPRHPIG